MGISWCACTCVRQRQRALAQCFPLNNDGQETFQLARSQCEHRQLVKELLLLRKCRHQRRRLVVFVPFVVVVVVVAVAQSCRNQTTFNDGARQLLSKHTL